MSGNGNCRIVRLPKRSVDAIVNILKLNIETGDTPSDDRMDFLLDKLPAILYPEQVSNEAKMKVLKVLTDIEIKVLIDVWQECLVWLVSEGLKRSTEGD